MKKTIGIVFTGLCALALAAVTSLPAVAQAPTKEKPRMYSYVSNWAIPRGQWAEMEKADMADLPILSKALSDGTIIGYGNDVDLVHQPDGETHDDWWSSMSMAGLMNVLDQFYKGGSATSPVLASATKHFDDIYVSRFYNWKPGSVKDAYTMGSSYKLKADAPDDAVDALAANLVGPLLEKMLADGTIVEYEIDTQAVHTMAPGTFWIFYISPNADGLDKVTAGIRAAMKSSPLSGPAFGSMVDMTPHRDYLARTNATYK